MTYVMCASDARFCAMAEMEREKYDELVRQAKEDPDAGRLGWLTDGRRDERNEKKEKSVGSSSGGAPSASKMSLTSEEWTLEAAREMAARALREGEGGTSR